MMSREHKRQSAARHIALALAILGLSACAAKNPPTALTPSGVSYIERWTESGEKTVASDYDKSADPRYQILLAEYHGRKGDIRKSLDLYLQAIKSIEDRAVVERALEISIYLSDFESALLLSGKWRTIEPDSFQAHLSHLSNLLLLGHTSQASSDLAAMLTGFGFDDIRYEQLRDRLFRLDGVSISYIGEVAGSINDLPARNGWWSLLMAEIAIGQLISLRKPQRDEGGEEADHKTGEAGLLAKISRYADAAVKAIPAVETAHQIKARAFLLANKIDEGMAYINTTVKKNPGFYSLYLMEARWLISASADGDEDGKKRSRIQAIELLERIRANRGTLPERHASLFAEASHLLAFVYSSGDEPDKSRQPLEDLTEFEDYAEYAFLSLAEQSIRDKQYKKAEQYLSRIRTVEHLSTMMILYVEVKIALKEWEAALESIRYYRQSGRDDESALNALLLEGRVYLGQEDYQRAFDLYSSGLVRFGDNRELKHSRSVAAHFLGRVDIVVADMTGILEQSPDDIQALNGLGYALACLTDRLDEAEVLLARALKLAPDNFAIIDSYGWLKFKQGKHDEARTHLERAWGGMPDPEIAAHLVELYWAVGQKDKARRFLLSSEQEFPDSHALKEVRTRLGL